MFPSFHHFDEWTNQLGMEAPGTVGFPFAISWWAAGLTKSTAEPENLLQQETSDGKATPSAKPAFGGILPPNIFPTLFLLAAVYYANSSSALLFASSALYAAMDFGLDLELWFYIWIRINRRQCSCVATCRQHPDVHNRP